MLDFMTHLTNENHKGLYTVPFFKEKTLFLKKKKKIS